MREQATKMGLINYQKSKHWLGERILWNRPGSCIPAPGSPQDPAIPYFNQFHLLPDTDRISLPTSNSATLSPTFFQQIPYGDGLLSLNVVRQRNTEVWHQNPPIPCWSLRAHEVLPFLPSVTQQIVPAGPKIFKMIASLLVVTMMLQCDLESTNGIIVTTESKRCLKNQTETKQKVQNRWQP